MSAPLQGTASAANAIARVSYTHDAMIDMLIANPSVSQGTLARHFGLTQAWVSRVMNSDAFQARLAVRKADIVDPIITQSIEEKFRALADTALEVVHNKLLASQDANLGLQALELSTKALGYGARKDNVTVQNNFVVALPAKATSSSEWAKSHGQVIEHTTH